MGVLLKKTVVVITSSIVSKVVKLIFVRSYTQSKSNKHLSPSAFYQKPTATTLCSARCVTLRCVDSANTAGAVISASMGSTTTVGYVKKQIKP